MKKIAKAYAPSGVTSFFEICDQKNGKPIVNPEQVGSRGGGFGLEKGIITKVNIEQSEKNCITIFINGKLAPEAETTRTAAKTMLDLSKKSFNVKIHHEVEVPIGAGFGTSAGGALTTALTLKQLLDLPLTYNQVGKIAHVAEVQCKTGLGTVGPLMISGCILTLEPGAPGLSVIDRIPLNADYRVVIGYLGGISTKVVLNSNKKRREINRYGNRTLNDILKNPTLKNFLDCSLDFAKKTGFLTPQLKQLSDLAIKAGAIGSAQNMVGEALHVLVFKEDVEKVVDTFKKVLPSQSIFASNLDFQGARLLSDEKIL